MPFASSPAARSFRSPIHRSRRFISRHPVLLIALVVMAALLAAAIDGPITRAASTSFAPKQDFATGPTPRAVAVGDLNQDGRLDMVAVNLDSNTISVLLNTTLPGATTTTFAVKQDFATGTEPVSVAVGDVNGDGKADLAVANFSANTVSVLLNSTPAGAATPTFAPKQDFAAGEGPIYVVFGDVNNDGKLDLAVVNVLSDNVSVLLNTTAPGAAPSFAAHQEFATGVGPVSVKLGDLNGDGKLDLAVANFNLGNVSVLLNSTASGAATPSFGADQEFTVGDGPSSISAGDLNADGKLDLVVTNFNVKSVSVLFNTTATGATVQSFSDNREFRTDAGPVSVTLADVNGDGRQDLAVANFESSSVSVLLSTRSPDDATPDFSSKQDFATGEAPVLLTAGDLNGDAKLDLAVANRNANTVSVLLNITDQGTATPSFLPKEDLDTGLSPRSIAAGDLNGDGKPDLATANVGSDNVSVLLNTTVPNAPTSFAPHHDFATGLEPVSLTMSDLNNDGRLDIAVANINSSTVSVLLNTTVPGAATLSFAAKQDFVTGENPLFVTTGDLNGDGKPDLVVANLTATISVLFNTTVPGAATSSFAVKQDFVTGDGPRSVTIGDLNNDGRLDLAVANFNSDTVAALLNTTNPGAATPSFAEIHDFATGFRPVSITSADVNLDGKLDLAVVNVNSSNVSVLLNTTAPGAAMPSFAAKHDFDTGANVRAVTAGDLNGDGKIDLAVVKSNANNVSVLLNSTTPGADTPTFTAKQDFDTGANPLSIASGDLNGDGKLDLATANFDANTLSVLVNTPAIVPAVGLSVQQGSLSSHLQIATVTNYGGNGSVIVKVIADDPTNGLTISNITNTDGNITADIDASCGAPTTTFTLRASDGSSTVTDTLNINVTPNTPPTLTYQDQTVALGASIDINPASGPSDNGSVPTINVQSSGTFTARIRATDVTGVVSIFDAAPVGTHTITIRATDNCGATTDSSFKLTVVKAEQTITFGGLENKTIGDPDFAVSATASSGLPVSFAASGDCTVSGNTVHLTAAGSCTITASQGGNSDFNPAPDVPQSFNIASGTPTPTPTPNASTVQFLNPVEVNEGDGRAVITVTRSGDTSGTASVDYSTADNDNFTIGCADTVNNLGAAFNRCDFAFSLDTLTFAAGETVKTFSVPIIDDSIPDGRETFSVILSNPVGTTLGAPSSVTVTIVDNDTVAGPNPIFDSPFFVRQQYLDFLSREPDQAGFDAWVGLLNNCPDINNNPTCDRVTVSSSFSLSQEFQLKAHYVFRFYRLAFNRLPTYGEIVVDMRSVTGQTPDEVFRKKAAFADAFVQRAEFRDHFGNSQFVATLMGRNNLTFITTPDPAAPDGTTKVILTADDLSDKLNSNVLTPAQALRAIVDSDEVFNLEFNQAFVAMEYYGYLRRTPDTDGFNAWLNFLNANPTDFRTIVNGFMNSSEYRLRFGTQ